MDFIFGPKDTEKTTCLLEMANTFINENSIKYDNGYILLFTPPRSKNDIKNTNIKNKKEYNFNQYLTRYMPPAIKNMDLIKCYELKTASFAFELLDNFLSISNQSKSLKLILIDDITNIINPWINEIINNKINSTKGEEKINKDDNNILFIYNEIFQQFLSKINALQKYFEIQCFISLNINIYDHINFTKYSPKIFKTIFPYIRTSYYLSKTQNEEKIIFNEFKLTLNARNDKIEYTLIENDENEEKVKKENNNNENDINYIHLKEFIEKEKKKNINLKNNIFLEKVNNWMKNTIGLFVENINNYKIFTNQLKDQKNQEEDSSYTQCEK